MEGTFFPFAEFLQKDDTLVIVNCEDDEIAMIEARELLTWYPHNCDCDVCKTSITILEAFKDDEIVRTKSNIHEAYLLQIGSELDHEALMFMDVSLMIGNFHPL